MLMCSHLEKFTIFAGLFPLSKDESSIAVIVGHEIGHIVAHHPDEMLGKLILYFTASVLFPMLGPVLFVPLLLGGGFFMVWDSRILESEADYIGMVLMAKARFDIRTAPDFWARAGDAHHQEWMEVCHWCNPDTSISGVLELLSSHPFVSHAICYAS